MRFISKIFLPKHHENKNYVYVKNPWNLWKHFLFPQKKYVWYLVLPINLHSQRNTMADIYKKIQIQINCLIEKIRYRWFSLWCKANTTSGLDGIQTISCLDNIPDHFLSRRPPATSGLDVAGNPKWICSRCNLHPPTLHFSRKKKGSHFDSDSLTVNTCPCTLTFLLPFPSDYIGPDCILTAANTSQPHSIDSRPSE